ncbi:hypothetical protein V8F20_006536 [Naviculisporaceae sp. PSN 640]
MEDDNVQSGSSKGKGKQVDNSEPATKHEDDSEPATKHKDGDGLLPRIAKSAASLPSALFSGAAQGGAGLASVGGGEKAGPSRAAQSLARVDESFTHIRPNAASSRETVKSVPVHEHIAQEEASFSAFLDSTDPFVPSNPPAGLEEAWQSHTHISEPLRVTEESVPVPLSVAEQQARDGQDVVALLTSWDEGDLNVPTDDRLTPEEMANLRRALFGGGEDSNQGLAGMVDNILNFTPAYLRETGPGADLDLAMHMGTSDRDETWQAWIGQWSRVLTEYQDEVWGDLGALVEQAREEVNKIEDSGGSISGQEAPAVAPALLRLRAILGHLRGST